MPVTTTARIRNRDVAQAKRVWGHKHNLTLWTIMFIIYGRCSLGVIGGRRARFAPALPSNRLSGWEAIV